MSIIHTRGLTRHFVTKNERVEAVRGIDIEVQAGELVAFLGPNGAGKSTSLRMLTTLLEPTAGEATVAGHNIRTDPMGVRRRIGYVGQGNGAGHQYRVRDELLTQGYCYGQSRAAAKARADELLDALELAPLAARTVESLSGGQRRRVDVAIGLMHRPPLLFLDEPSTGLDPHNRANLWEHILRLRQEAEMTIFMTTHYLDEADAMAERVMVIDHGQVIADDTPARLKDNLAGDLLTVAVKGEEAARCAANLAEEMAAGQSVEIVPPTPHTDGSAPANDSANNSAAMLFEIRLRVPKGNAMLPHLLRNMAQANIEAQTAEVKRPTLDDVFLRLTGRSLRENAINA